MVDAEFPPHYVKMVAQSPAAGMLEAASTQLSGLGLVMGMSREGNWFLSFRNQSRESQNTDGIWLCQEGVFYGSLWQRCLSGHNHSIESTFD
jgi:hypothetical protein